MKQRLAVLRSVTLVSVSTYVEYALGLVVSIWIARTLGPANFGRYAFTVWLSGWLMTCSNHALTTSSTKFIAEADGASRPDLASHIAYRLSRYQNLSSLIVVVLFVASVLMIRPSEWQQPLWPIIVLVIVAVVSKANYAMLVGIEKGQESFEPVSIATVLSGVINVALITAATMAHADMVSFFALFAVACLMLNLINRLAFHRYCRPFSKGPIPEDVSKRLTRHLRLTAALVLLISLRSSTIEVFLLNTFATSTAVGFFAIATTLTRGAVELLSVGLTTTLLPYMAKSFGKGGTEQAARLLTEAARFYWAMGLIIAGIGLVTTPEIVTLMYGNRYVGAIPTIEAMLVLAGLLLVSNSIGAFQIVVDRQDDRVRISILALAVNALLGIALVPSFGLAGAMITYAGTRFAEFGLAIFYLRKATSGRLPVVPMARLFAAALVATATAWLVVDVIHSRFGFIAGGLIFVGIFLPASFLVRYWSDEDYELMTMVTNRLGPAGRTLMRGLSSLHGATAKASS
ncbi:oligosaccharide flippase family protein [Dyella sp. 2HG41-7]|uniref:oligosaccharide flippase family protein n=1 Tax=Dyella sp. 2HG41-7 TaxID=2883239 RepID=UPI001F2D7801|nr:oligosaccharide flippase family protein [Dyella sp. 2HG41-7]